MSKTPNTVTVHQALAAVWPESLTCAEVAKVAGLTLRQTRRAMTTLSSQGVAMPFNRPGLVLGYAWRVNR